MLMGCFYNTPNIILCILYNKGVQVWYIGIIISTIGVGFCSLLVLDWMGNARSLKT